MWCAWTREEDASGRGGGRIGETRAKRNMGKSDERGAAEASVESEGRKKGAVDVVKDVGEKIEHAAQDVGAKIAHAGQDFVHRMDSAMRGGTDAATTAADVNGDGVVDSSDASAAVSKCGSKCTVQ